jgi:hypothetical protein
MQSNNHIKWVININQFSPQRSKLVEKCNIRFFSKERKDKDLNRNIKNLEELNNRYPENYV